MATERIEINPVTRIEGHAKITVNLDAGGKVSDALFSVHSFRGFERFLKGAPVERLPAITSRICGICYTAHRICSVRALENALNVKVSNTTDKLRRLLLFGQYIESHALSLVLLSLPDLLYPREKPKNRNVQYLLAKHRELVEAALRLRTAGSRCAEVVGRRAVHPISAVIGGITTPLTDDERKTLDTELDGGKEALDGLMEVFVSVLEKGDDEILGLGAIESNYFGLHDGDKLSFDRGTLRLIDSAGATLADFPAEDYFDYVKEEEADFSYMKFPVTKDGASFRVGPLARVNIAAEAPTQAAADALAKFEGFLPRPWNGTIPYHYARLVEAIYAWEAAKELLDDPDITSDDVKPKPLKMKAAEGIGVLEAPRGTLVHNYVLSADGFCEKAQFVVATQHNNAGINESLNETAARIVKGPDVPEVDLNKLEMIVRAYDPCLSCATHELAGRPFEIEVRGAGGDVLRSWS
ncbi:MAG: Ni/Fe hydrogenase subunit alpha [Candidatus Coatesbacteria bacterium]|nr:MAG: Ni/Fe hydrogenase subunit alpha [Candidatus Coatesbacteria bacterium]